MKVRYAIVHVGDMSRAVEFYRDVVGLPLRFESPGWTEFATEGATLALHRAEAEGAVGCRHGFQVPDLDVFHAKMVREGVPCVQEPTETFGARIAQYRDPDGLVFSVGEEGGSGDSNRPGR